MLYKIWSRWGIDKPCVFWMSASASGLCSLKDTIKSSYFSNKVSFYKHGSSLLESLPAVRWSSVCMILWYIWKGMHHKVFSNVEIDPRDTLKLAETESILWAEAHIVSEQRTVSHVEVTSLPPIRGRWCFTDGS